MNSETVAQDMFTVLHGQPAPVVTRWTYSAADPFAVTLGIRAAATGSWSGSWRATWCWRRWPDRRAAGTSG